jgi:trans-2,3-dihydro-3-hydroxyanthranilate isomerase
MAARMKYPFVTLDVFTDTRFAGNPLAVVFDADALDSAAMQTVAREFSHPETVFILKPASPANTARARIFTPGVELPFAGHPTVGAALALALKSGGSPILLEESIGLLKCSIENEDADRGHATFILPALPSEAGAPADTGVIAAALGLAAGAIGFDGHAPSKWSAGNTFTFVPVRDLEAIRGCKIVDAAWDAAFEANNRSSAFVFCAETVHKTSRFHARMFAPRLGVREDPATGSAAAAFAGFCARSLSLPDGEHHFVIEQGFEMGRPSLIELTLTMRNGALLSASIGGSAIVITEGMIEV